MTTTNQIAAGNRVRQPKTKQEGTVIGVEREGDDGPIMIQVHYDGDRDDAPFELAAGLEADFGKGWIKLR